METTGRYALRIISVLIVLTLGTQLQANTTDYDLNQATRTLDNVSSSLSRLQPGDVNAYNRISRNMDKAAKHLEATQSKSHPDFQKAAQRWTELQAQMAQIAQVWNAAAAAQQQQQAAAQQQQEAAAQQQAATAQQQSATIHAQPVPRNAQPEVAQPKVEPVDLDSLMDKYQRQNLPALADDAGPQQAREYAEQMKALQTTLLEADIATIDAALASGAASEEDARRVRFWITDSFQRTISENIRVEVQKHEGLITSMMYSADLINSIEDGDMNGAYRVAGPVHGPNNKVRLDAAVNSGAIVAVFNDVFGTQTAGLASNLDKLKRARARVDELEPAAQKQGEVLANAPKKQRTKNPDFLAAIAQKFWLDGSVTAESTADGSIWIDANDVGDITHNGEIWIDANERGSIEPNGDVWFDGNQVGSLESNGEVWRSGNQVGLIDDEGTVWVNGNPSGEGVPYNGEWKRAAILYYFRDYFGR